LRQDKNENFISSTTITDNFIDTQYKEKARIKMDDDHIHANTENCIIDMTAQTIVEKNSTSTIRIDGGTISFTAGSGATIVMDSSITMNGSTINLN
jgi:predicted membrane protein